MRKRKKKESLVHATTLMNLKDIILIEINHLQNDNSVSFHLHEIKVVQNHRNKVESAGKTEEGKGEIVVWQV